MTCSDDSEGGDCDVEPGHGDGGQCAEGQDAEHFEIGDNACSVLTCHDQGSATVAVRSVATQEAILLGSSMYGRRRM